MNFSSFDPEYNPTVGVRTRAIVLVTLLAFAGATASLGAAQTGGGTDALTADEIRITVEVQSNGSAIWTVEYLYRLESDNGSAGFERLEERFATDRSTYRQSVRTDVERTVGAVENATDRSMRVRGLRVDARRQAVPHEAGLVVHRFQWSGFARVNDSTIRAGGPLRGFYIGSDTQLTVRWPEDYEPERIDPGPDDRIDGGVVWKGGRFDATEPRIVFTRPSGVPSRAVSIAGLLVVSVGVGSFTALRRRANRSPSSESTEESREPPQPLSNEEQVLWVLDQHDGRVKQQTLVAECEWGDSKTSKVVRTMAEEGTIEVFRLGRENVISKPGETDDR